MKESVAKVRQLRIAEQTQVEIAEIRAQLERIESKLDELLEANGPKPAGLPSAAGKGRRSKAESNLTSAAGEG